MLGRVRHGTEDFLIVRQPDGTRAHLPQWMTLPAAGDVPTHWPPRMLLRCLLALRGELDAVLCSSTISQAHGGVDEANPAASDPARASRPVRRRNGASTTDAIAAASRRPRRTAEPTPVAGGKSVRRR
ncbi:conserved hypothetical protein [Thiomonas sp. X19]|uniref:Uncharacterized protein n=1 Tax=mine drainage metagenome TaxID=410659 RepID=E6PLC5_9ZZZZ|nr:conserved hypothetical protein [Thiomonas sp. X19]SCC93377.1 conserved hypothetical protein [Thiomonas sp. X19]SCC94492.1 conserved hypothetical protein [Thiomonas sp. X19]